MRKNTLKLFMIAITVGSIIGIGVNLQDVFSSSLYKQDNNVIRYFNMTEHLLTADNDKDYCHTSTCIIEKANERMDKVESDAYWQNLKMQDYINDLDNLEKEIGRIN